VKLAAIARACKAREFAAQPAYPDNDLFEPSALRTVASIFVAAPIPVNCAKDSSGQTVDVSLAALAAGPSVEA
jgi:hypothetical protein